MHTVQHVHRRPYVLIVDDERAFAEVVGELLNDEGYLVVRAYDGLHALSLLSDPTRLPDLVLCDVMLPGVTGDRIAAELRRRYPTRRLPVVLLSANEDPRVRLRDVWFLAKPLDFDEFVGFLQDVLHPQPSIA
jgi:CheY-like chemotaxis protein